MSQKDSAYLCSLPKLPVPAFYKGNKAPLLPYKLDNSTQPYFRPAYNQAGYSCGQAALVGYNFTYEINRVRELPGNVPENQYPTHFTWNFWNAGNMYGGVSYFTSMEILKGAGNPTVSEYGGMSYGGEKRWMNGYDNYYNAMQNRITTAYSLKIDTPEGIEYLKHYIHDHLDSSNVGGLASFYANQPGLHILPEGTPEEGKHVVVFWNYSTHALTIVGWNDSICWDYNSDGQYTNDIDINNDGVVNVKDWEIGGFKFVNSYGGVPNWADEGFCYMMYKTVADEYGQGGIWNNTVNTLKVKESCSPQLTMKITLKHTRRKAVKVMAGFSTDTTATEPEQIFDFPIYNYQGGNNYMQGGTSEEDKTIEFGLDISHFLSYLEPGDHIKFFLIINEYDPEYWGHGDYINFSIIDYINGVNEIPCSQSNIPIPHNGTVTVSIVHQVNHDEVNIDNVNLPPAPAGGPYNCQLNASGGTTPYFWRINHDYTETDYTGNFPTVNTNHLYPSNNNNGTVEQAIDFSFPFYGQEFETITIHTDGFLKFDDDIYIWPYFQSNELLFKKTACIAPYMTDLRIYPAQGDGIWYEGDESGAIFYWKTSINELPTETNLNFAVKLFPSGDIKFYYGEMQTNGEIEWYGGTSKGNSLDYQFFEISGNDTINENSVIDFSSPFYPNEMTLSENGIFSGTPLQAYNGIDIKFKATDNNNIFTNKILQFSANGIIMDPSIVSGGDEIIEFAENAVLSVLLTNISGDDLTNAYMRISINDTNYILIDSVEYFGTLINGNSVNLEDAFNFDVSPMVPNYHNLNIATEIISTDTTYLSNLFFTVFAPVIQSDYIFVNDGDNQILDPGETTDIIVGIENSGGAKAQNISVILSSNDNFVTINNGSGFILSLPADSISPMIFNISVDEDAPIGHIIEFALDISTDNGYINSDTFYLSVGLTLEDFESGNFDLFSWGFDGNRNWKITEDHVYEGAFSARSGHITHDQESSLIIDVDVQNESELSFYRKVSCEDDANNNNWDYLAFLIDDVEQGRWDGQLEWGQETYSISAGYHRFEWRFHKDHSVSNYFDCAWIDTICFPSGIDIAHNLSFNPEEIIEEMKPDSIKIDTLIISSFSDFGEVDYQIYVDFTPQQKQNDNKKNRCIGGSYLECSKKYQNTGQNFSWIFTTYNASDDNEWIRDIFMDFPEGIIIDSVTNFVGGSLGELEDDSITGNDANIHWHGEDSTGWGVIKGNETAVATVYGHADTSLIEDFSVITEVHGDIYGAEPHILYIDIDFVNLGEINNWITLDTLSGTINSGDSDELYISFNTMSLPDGNYSCELLITDYFNNETIIPVSLLVDTFLYQDEIPEITNPFTKIFPNPFINETTIHFYLNKNNSVSLDIFNSKGNKVRTLIRGNNFSKGNHSLIWNGTDKNGKFLSSGVYYFQLKIGEKVFSRKCVIVR
ncbi:MAG: T9SS type A sorting domain-containing protein [Bacteroidales bacterium]|nr:T9SS type A sorting domain-containing protein [Bacteroidales bacterium]